MKANIEKYKCIAIATYISAYATEHGGNAPTVDEIADHFGIWKSTAQGHLQRLYDSGIAERRDGKLVLVGAMYIPPDWLLKQLSA